MWPVDVNGSFRMRSGMLRGLVLVAMLAPGLAGAAPAAGQLERGRELYDKMCAVCHGPNGEGYRADQAPRIAHPAFLGAVSDAYLRKAIAQGRPGTTMSAWSTERGGPLSSADVDAVVALVRSWGEGPPARLDERLLSGDPARGKDIYAEECARCHGDRGVDGPNVHIGSPHFLSAVSNGFLRDVIRNGRSGTSMPGFEDSLSKEQIEDVVALLRTFQLPGFLAKNLPVRPPPVPLGPVPLNPKGPPPVGFGAYPKMTPADTVKGQLDKGARFALLDARAPSDYAVEHIAGAVSVPFYDPSPYVDKLPKNAWLVCYCACPHAESGELAQKLVEAGFTKVTVLDEGLRVWKERNYPTHTGDKP
jgi:cytochrome c oxidase cbb3-type subunit 3/ubiquinol-cytochrome c reductase cytochrome c subunit